MAVKFHAYKTKWVLRITDVLEIHHRDAEGYPGWWHRLWMRFLLGWKCRRVEDE